MLCNKSPAVERHCSISWPHVSTGGLSPLALHSLDHLRTRHWTYFPRCNSAIGLFTNTLWSHAWNQKLQSFSNSSSHSCLSQSHLVKPTINIYDTNTPGQNSHAYLYSLGSEKSRHYRGSTTLYKWRHRFIHFTSPETISLPKDNTAKKLNVQRIKFQILELSASIYG